MSRLLNAIFELLYKSIVAQYSLASLDTFSSGNKTVEQALLVVVDDVNKEEHKLALLLLVFSKFILMLFILDGRTCDDLGSMGLCERALESVAT